MFIFDIFKQEARRLRTMSLVVAGGFFLLLTGLWWVQVVSSQTMQHRMVTQSFRKPPVPAERGRIFDCNSNALVENRAQYNVVVYLEELRGQFTNEYAQMAKAYLRDHPGTVNGKLPAKVANPMRLEAEYRVVSNITFRTAETLKEPPALTWDRFTNFYARYTFLPLPIILDLSPASVAVFSEQCAGQPWLDLERQPVLSYVRKTTAAHLLGYVVRTGQRRDYLSAGYDGKTGIEGAFDDQLKGAPGTNLVQVDNQGFSHHVDTLTPNQAGNDIYLTISLPIQQAAEQALLAHWGKDVRGAVVVMDVHSGDILAMASSPTYDPNIFVGGVSQAQMDQFNDPKLKPLFNRATDDIYFPGSTFKIITAIAGLESGVIDVNAVFASPGRYMEHNFNIDDTAAPGNYTFETAFYHSSNTYFCHYGWEVGLNKLLEVAARFHLGEKADFATHEEQKGLVPKPNEAPKNFQSPYVAIGQEVSVTPLQMAGMICVIANGGTLFWPRIVSEIRNPNTGAIEQQFPSARVRDHVAVKPEHLQIIRHAMLGDTEAPGANAYNAFHRSSHAVLQQAGFRVAGKTGTAQVASSDLDYKKVTWFDSYGPYEDPRYAVVVMIINGASGGDACAPVAQQVYEGIVLAEKKEAAKKAPNHT